VATILVCPLSRVEEMVALERPERVVSLLDPEWAFPELGSAYVDRHLRLAFHDVHDPEPGMVVPSVEHVRELLRFVAAWDRARPILIHCRAGIGRSAARTSSRATRAPAPTSWRSPRPFGGRRRWPDRTSGSSTWPITRRAGTAA
jgi:predicted protein tyrosine phosphatase